MCRLLRTEDGVELYCQARRRRRTRRAAKAWQARWRVHCVLKSLLALSAMPLLSLARFAPEKGASFFAPSVTLRSAQPGIATYSRRSRVAGLFRNVERRSCLNGHGTFYEPRQSRREMGRPEMLLIESCRRVL